jgi:hypothetical protein
MKRISKNDTVLVLLRQVRLGGEAAEPPDSIPASTPGTDHDPGEAPMQARDRDPANLRTR